MSFSFSDGPTNAMRKLDVAERHSSVPKRIFCKYRVKGWPTGVVREKSVKDMLLLQLPSWFIKEVTLTKLSYPIFISNSHPLFLSLSVCLLTLALFIYRILPCLRFKNMPNKTRH